MVRNIIMLVVLTFKPWLSGLSVRVALLTVAVLVWLLRDRDGLSMLGAAVMLSLLLTVSNLPPRPYYAYAGLPGAAIMFAALSRMIRRSDNRALLLIPLLLILGTYLEARDEVGRLSVASDCTEGIIDRLAEADSSLPGEGSMVLSGITQEVAGYTTLWPGAFREALATRGIEPNHEIAGIEHYWETIYCSMQSDSSLVVHFIDFSNGSWTSSTFMPSERIWIEDTVEVTVEVKEASVTISDSLWMFNSCRILSIEPCSLAVIDPFSHSLHKYLPVESEGDTLWFDLEDARAWILSERPFYLHILHSRRGSIDSILFSSRRLWLPDVMARIEGKEAQMNR